jgi:T4 superinfection immunity protein
MPIASLLASSSGGAGLVALIIVALLYFLPLIIAVSRGVRNQGSVAVINVFLGWTLIGWIVALAMAARTVERHA